MTLRSIYLRANKFRQLVETELETRETYDLPLRRRLWLWRRGFLSRSAYLYDLDDGRHRRYLTDFERSVRTSQINGEWAIALANKLVFHWLMAPFDDHRMDVYGMVRDGRTVSVAGEQPTVEAPDPSPVFEDGEDRTQLSEATRMVLRHLEAEGRVVLKWIKGGGGHNVYICEMDDGTCRVNGESYTPEAFDDLVSRLDEYLVCEFVEQSAFSASFYPETTNTIRLITMYDEEADEVFAPIAILRMGSAQSEPMDNFSQGGLNAEIDVETGTLGEAVQLPQSRELVGHAEHPDTGTDIEGVEIPAWATVRDRVLEIAEANSHVPYVGWDVVLTDDEGGFRLIEGNSYPGMKSLQVHRPMLDDDRARAFYARHGVVGR